MRRSSVRHAVRSCLECLDLGRHSRRPQGEVDLPVVDLHHEVVAPLVAIVEVVKRRAATEQRTHRLPRRFGGQARSVYLEVEITPHHQAGHRAPELHDPSSTTEKLDQAKAVDDVARLPLELSLTMEQLLVVHHASMRRRFMDLPSSGQASCLHRGLLAPLARGYRRVVDPARSKGRARSGRHERLWPDGRRRRRRTAPDKHARRARPTITRLQPHRRASVCLENTDPARLLISADVVAEGVRRWIEAYGGR